MQKRVFAEIRQKPETGTSYSLIVLEDDTVIHLPWYCEHIASSWHVGDVITMDLTNWNASDCRSSVRPFLAVWRMGQLLYSNRIIDPWEWYVRTASTEYKTSPPH